MLTLQRVVPLLRKGSSRGWKSNFLSLTKLRRVIYNVMKPGDLVRFCKNPPREPDHCNIWHFAIGLLLSYNSEINECKILCEGEVHTCDSKWVDVDDTGVYWLPGRKMK